MPPFLLFSTPTRQGIKRVVPNAPTKPKQAKRQKQPRAVGFIDFTECYSPKDGNFSSALSKKIGENYNKLQKDEEFCIKRKCICSCSSCTEEKQM